MIDWQGGAGFVTAEIVALTEPMTAPTATPTPETSDAFVDAGSDVRAQLKQDAPLFETPNELSSIVTTMKSGDNVTVLSYSDDWARIRTQSGREGYARLESLTAVEDETKGKKYLYVTAGSTDVYVTWSTDGGVIETAYYGEALRVGAYNSVWACVKVGDVTGYVRMEALSEAKPAPIEGGNITRAPLGMMAVAKQDVAVYDSAASGAKQVMNLTQGQRVSVEAYNNAWALIRVDGVVGYVRLQYLERVGA